MATGSDRSTTAEVVAAASEASPSPGERLEALRLQLEREAAAAGVQVASVRRHLADIELDPTVTALAGAQTEHERTVGQYLALIVTPERIELGRQRLAEQAETLAAVEARWGLDRHVLAAVWGVETRYGAALGQRSVLRSLATLAAQDTRRPHFWRAELLAAIAILERGDMPPEALNGSWAGAIGHTQFMPSTFNRFAVDHDGDGRRDVVRSVADALASAANYLAASGWQRGEAWGVEVELPDGFDFALSAPTQRGALTLWAERGIRRTGGESLPFSVLEHRLLLPAGARGPAFLVNRNFEALLRYNPAVPYALAVAHLSDRLADRAPIAAAWPEETALSRPERMELQERLAALGLDVGGVDGIIGSLTRSAIRSYQKAQSLPEDGHPSSALLDRLRAQR